MFRMHQDSVFRRSCVTGRVDREGCSARTGYTCCRPSPPPHFASPLCHFPPLFPTALLPQVPEECVEELHD